MADTITTEPVPVKLKADIKIKFRSFGITYANISYTKIIDLPTEVAYIGKAVHFEKLVYNDHGVSVALSLF